MEILLAIVVTLGIVVGVLWLIKTFIGWTVVGFLIMTLISLASFAIKDPDTDKPHFLDSIIAFSIFTVWGMATGLYWTDVFNPIHSLYTLILTICVSCLPLIVAWLIFHGKPKLRFLTFSSLAGVGAYAILMFPVLGNDYNRWLHLELPLRPTIEKMLASDISKKNPEVIDPCLIVEKRERTPNDEVCYSGLNERLNSSFHVADGIDGVNTIIYLNFYFKEHAAYNVYYNVRPGDSLSTSSGTVQSYRHMCQIYIYSPGKNTKVHYVTISGPAPRKPTDSSDSWGDRIADQEVIDKLNLLLKQAPA